MAGTDRSREARLGGPAIVLVEPQLGENIGTAARAMLNFGLTDLRLVRPRDDWPNDHAVKAASGATPVLEGARVFASTAEAIADLHHVFATTARPRDMLKATLTPAQLAATIGDLEPGRAGVLFGPERAGLDNDDVALAEALVEVPVNPAFASLNLAQAVLLVAYECARAGRAEAAPAVPPGRTRPANREELIGFFEHLEGELDASGFLYPKEKRPTMVRNIRNLFQRAELMEQEVRTLRGIVAALAGRRRRSDN
ncbi:MAG TPA: RNA methyltransferase [Alphaproteobacteria bacterium]|jgi:tRNA/rRNA methyltransferase|nr:RNA methyltransferase [Alphaproteobacteria bacterium]HJM49526.1 RNA methyltransferase [Alphaproteobacteria bacterium]